MKFIELGLLAIIIFAIGCQKMVVPRSEPIDNNSQLDQNTNSDQLIEKAQAIVSNSLPALAAGGNQWRAEQQCVSCHLLALSSWSHTAALKSGIITETSNISSWLDYSLNQGITVTNKAGELGGVGNETMAQILLARPDNNDPRYSQIVDLLLNRQNQDGSWTADGQLFDQRLSALEITENGTMWIVNALISINVSDSKINAAVDRAMSWLGTVKLNPESSENLATRALIEIQIGESRNVDAIKLELESRRSEDGGWAWKTGESSDAFGTGLVTYAMTKMQGCEVPVLNQSIAYLANQQRGDGLWTTRSSKKDSRVFNRKLADEIRTHWASGFASVAASQVVKSCKNEDSDFASIFNKIIKPKCLSCHSPSDPISLDNYLEIMKYVVPESPSSSPLFTQVQTGKMPSGLDALNSIEIEAIQNWILIGAQD